MEEQTKAQGVPKARAEGDGARAYLLVGYIATFAI